MLFCPFIGYMRLVYTAVYDALKNVLITRGVSVRREWPGSSSDPLHQLEAGFDNPLMCASQSRVTLITSTMQLEEVINCLVQHGCKDITSDLNLEHCAQQPFARGGLGVIYQGMLNDGRMVAIKCVEALGYWELLEHNQKHIKRIAKELYTWSRCDHPGVLKLFGLARFRGHIALVSPLMSGGSLTRYILRHPSTDRLQLCIQLTRALEYLHLNGVVHGDIKPDNVVMGDQGHTRLADFGSAVLTGNASLNFSQTTSLGFTIRFAAPELLEGKSRENTFETDMYALGMTILSVMTGKVPYAGQSSPAMVFEVTVNKRIPPRSDFGQCLANQEVKDKLWDLLVRCWAYDPANRPTALEAKEVLTEIEKISLIGSG